MMLSSLAKNRWKRFKSNKRAWYSFWIFILIFIFSLGVDFICNNKPLVLHYKNRYFFPIFVYYPETDFGGEFDIEPDYKDLEFIETIKQANGWILWPPIRYNYFTVNMDLASPPPSRPTWENLLGTDDQGRDVFTRLLYGLRISLLFGLTLALLSTLFGILAGAIQGYFGGWIDLFFQRFIEIWSGLPVLFLLMILSSLVQPTVFWLLGLMVLFSWMSLVGVVRAEFLRARHYTYVKAAQVLGVKTFSIMVRHILPNAMISALSYFPFLVSASITTLTSLDFLGFGLPPGAPSLGEMLQQAKANLYAPWLGLTAFFSIAIILVLVTFIGEGLRDAFDPHKV